MARTRATAMSALVLAVGLTGAVSAPFIAQSASASSAVVARDPSVPPCDADQVCETPEVTVTTTITQEPDPETTITKTITPTSKTKTPTPKKSSNPALATTKTTTPPPLQPIPSQNVQVPPATTAPPTTPEQSVQLPTVAPEDSLTASPPATPADSTPAGDSVQLELHAATPEFDQRTLAQKLSIPALVLVLLALFAVLIFEGRLRRMAHAAAVRKAGPLPGPEPHGYPAGPGYTTASFPAPGYPGGTAYAPIISFVPVQTYPATPPQYPTYPEPYPPAPTEPPVVLHPDEFDSYNHQPPTEPAAQSEYRAPFEPLIPADQAPQDDRPFGSAASAESGDSEPWQSDDSTIVHPRPQDLS
ncbi:hypothetical protein ACIBHX_21720 [Nonomuraea sp. NPDC050536]|uniref:hypothetical protein n=1 Tax=Nonomuraea sp. NPDC050536 TaxID=3364366 RepID=UPI0037C5032E